MTSLLHTTTGLLKLTLIAGFRISRYHMKPYEELAAIVAAMVHPSDSVTRATPAITQKPTKISDDRISRAVMTPSGMSLRPTIYDTPATTNATQGTRKMPTVETSFAPAY